MIIRRHRYFYHALLPHLLIFGNNRGYDFYLLIKDVFFIGLGETPAFKREGFQKRVPGPYGRVYPYEVEEELQVAEVIDREIPYRIANVFFSG